MQIRIKSRQNGFSQRMLPGLSCVWRSLLRWQFLVRNFWMHLCQRNFSRLAWQSWINETNFRLLRDGCEEPYVPLLTDHIFFRSFLYWWHMKSYSTVENGWRIISCGGWMRKRWIMFVMTIILIWDLTICMRRRLIKEITRWLRRCGSFCWARIIRRTWIGRWSLESFEPIMKNYTTFYVKFCWRRVCKKGCDRLFVKLWMRELRRYF